MKRSWTLAAIVPLILSLALLSCGPESKQPTDADLRQVDEMLSLADTGTNLVGSLALARDLYDRGIRTPEILYGLAFTTDKVKPDEALSLRLYGRCLTMLDRDPASTRDPLLKIKAMFYSGFIVLRQKKEAKADIFLNAVQSALERFDSAGRLEDGVGLYLLAYCYERHKQSDLSIQTYQRALDWFEKYRPQSYYYRACFYNIGLHYYTLLDYTRALVYWRQAWEKEPASGFLKETYRKWYETAREAEGFDR